MKNVVGLTMVERINKAYTDGHNFAVEQIRNEILMMRTTKGKPPESIRVVELMALLDSAKR